MGAELLRLWTERLLRDYDHICFLYRVKLRRPVIRIETSTGRWGLWDAETRTLSLAESLLRTQSWDIVLEILKHEMAHQMVSEHFGSDQAHGPLFQRACGLLGVSKWAARAETDLEGPLTGRTSSVWTPEEERRLNRVEKLLALASSSNEHEALAAMEKVRELYTKYQVERLKEKKPSDFDYLILPLRRKRVERYQTSIASLLSDHFFVEVIHSSLYDAQDACEYKTLELLGTAQNTRMAEYVFHFLSNQLPLLWRNFPKKRTGRVSRSSYYLGVLSGFREKLEMQREAQLASTDTESKALLVAPDKQLEAYVGYRYPRLVRIARGRRKHDASTYEAGKSAGLRLVLKKGLTQEQGNRGGRLTS